MAERSVRGVPLRAEAAAGCDSGRGRQRAVVAYSLIQAFHLNNADPRAWLVGILLYRGLSRQHCPRTPSAELAYLSGISQSQLHTDQR